MTEYKFEFYVIDYKLEPSLGPGVAPCPVPRHGPGVAPCPGMASAWPRAPAWPQGGPVPRAPTMARQCPENDVTCQWITVTALIMSRINSVITNYA